MTGVCTTAEWIAKDGHEDEFMEAWLAFASWARTMPGAGDLRLTRDVVNESRFVSFGLWDDLDAVHRWKSDEGFPPRMAQVQQHVAAFAPAELEVVRVAAGTAAGVSSG